MVNNENNNSLKMKTFIWFNIKRKSVTSMSNVLITRFLEQCQTA